MNSALPHNKLRVHYRVLEQLESVLLQELRRSHPAAEDVAVDLVTVLRPGVVLQER